MAEPATLTPQEIQDISEPIVAVYEQLTDDLLANVLKHIATPTTTHTASWEIQKLSEMGKLTAESAALIRDATRQVPQHVRDAMEETRRLALERIEREMDAITETQPLSAATVTALHDYLDHNFRDTAEDVNEKLNLVNQTMLYTTVRHYSNEVDKIERLANEQKFLNVAAGAVITGTETRTKALERAIVNANFRNGITAFKDKAGRSWTPEAYVNMVIRSTVHNTAVQSVKADAVAHGCNVFQVSSHKAARPLCYPYQGKFYSWDDTAGDVELGNGNVVHYEPISSTSYGEPAGLFGINCGHFPIPIVPGVTIPHGADDIQPEKENDKAYKESQKQRRLEREIRYKRTLYESMKRNESADDDFRKQLKDDLAKSEDKMRKFIAQTGRTRRYDREKIYKFSVPDKQDKEFQASGLTEVLDREKVLYRPVKKYAGERTTEQIIGLISGPDQTNGSCASLSMAYAGQKAGYDVYDFRGGNSQTTFAGMGFIERYKNINGIEYYEATDTNKSSCENARDVLQNVQDGKEYCLFCGTHSAVVRKYRGNRPDIFQLEYLELQSADKNGWRAMSLTDQEVDVGGWYTHMDSTLKVRFGCKEEKDPMLVDAAMFEVGSVKDSKDFRSLLGYINTPPDNQKKGEGGYAK